MRTLPAQILPLAKIVAGVTTRKFPVTTPPKIEYLGGLGRVINDF